jgi:selenium-binding protein 1
VSDPHTHTHFYDKNIGKLFNLLWNCGAGTRLYFTSSLLANWDKKGEDNEQFLRGYTWDGKELKPAFDLDFTALKLGRPHHMLFGSTKLGAPRTTVASN